MWYRFHISKDRFLHKLLSEFTKSISFLLHREIYIVEILFHKVKTFIYIRIVILYHPSIHHLKVVLPFICYYWYENAIYQELCLAIYTYIIWTHISRTLPNTMTWELFLVPFMCMSPFSALSLYLCLSVCLYLSVYLSVFVSLPLCVCVFDWEKEIRFSKLHKVIKLIKWQNWGSK